VFIPLKKPDLKNTTFVAAIFTLFITPGYAQRTPLRSNVESRALSLRANEMYQAMSLEEKVGQLFIVGFQGTTLSPQIEQHLKAIKPGAVIAFKRNIRSSTQIAQLNKKLQHAAMKYTKSPFLIMVDQEGGNVSRIKTRPFPPSALAIGFTKNTDFARQSGKVTGEILRELGFNMNLAPVTDLSDPYSMNFIGQRSFGNDPEFVYNFASQYSTGLLTSKVLPTFKHFPGHGGTNQDSHKLLPRKIASFDSMMTSDLYPFQKISKSHPHSAVMVAHVAYPLLDERGIPATFSKKIITGILKDRLKYKGLIITDDIEMTAAKEIGSIERRAQEAFLAGNDMIMVAWSRRKQMQAYQALVQKFRTGELPKERLRESVIKILKTKLRLAAPETPLRKVASIASRKKELIQLANQIAKTNINNYFSQFPEKKGLLKEQREVIVYSADYGFVKEFKRSFRKRVLYYPLRRGQTSPLRTNSKTRPSTYAIYYVTGTGTARLLSSLTRFEKRNIFVVNAASPGLIKGEKDFRGVLHINSRNYKVGSWVAQELKTGS
jgi:beta-N-acetylhexosaminidase